MSEERPTDSNTETDASPSRDSRLDAFLRQATVIVAAEKGMSSRARAKLKSVADGLNLPDGMFDDAIDRLQASSLRPDELKRYEKEFLGYLDDQFSRLPHGVLSVAMEQHAIERAESHFGINANRAEQLIGHQAAFHGMGRLDRVDAVNYGRQMIVHAIDDASGGPIDDSSADGQSQKQRLLEIGRQWGLNVSDVDRVIEQHAADARRSRWAAARRKFVLATTAAMMLLMIAGGIYLLVERFTAETPTPVAEPVEIVSMPDDSPARFSNNTMQLIAELTPRLSTRLNDADPKIRAQAVDEIISRSCEQTDDGSRWMSLIQSLFHEPDDDAIAEQIVDSLETQLQSRDIVSVKGFAATFRANEIAQELLHEPSRESPTLAQTSRLDRLAEIMQMQTNADRATEPDTPEGSLSASRLARRHWNQLLSQCWTSPGRAAICVEPLSEMTQDKIEAESLVPLRERAVKAILKADPAKWRHIRDSIATAVTDASDEEVLEWIDLYEDAPGGLASFLSPRLLQRAGLPAERVPTRIAASLSNYRQQQRSAPLQPLIQRNEKIAALTNRLLEDDGDSGLPAKNDDLPDRIAETIRLGNLSLAFLRALDDHGNQTHDDWDRIDRLIDAAPMKLVDLVSLDRETSPERRDGSRQQPVRRSIPTDLVNRIRTRESGQLLDRVDAMQRIAAMTSRTSNVPHGQAVTLGQYLLAGMDLSEEQQVEPYVSPVAQWPSVMLAISDQIAIGKVEREQAVRIAELALGGPLDVTGEGDEWSKQISRRLFDRAVEQIDRLSLQEPDELAWSRLKTWIDGALQQRMDLLDHGQKFDGSADSLLAIQIRSIATQRSGASSSLTPVDQQRLAQLIRQNTGELTKSVIASEFLARTVARQLADRSPAARLKIEAILDDLKRAEQRSPSVGQMLMLTQRVLVRLWSIERNEKIDQMIRQVSVRESSTAAEGRWHQISRSGDSPGSDAAEPGLSPKRLIIVDNLSSLRRFEELEGGQ